MFLNQMFPTEHSQREYVLKKNFSIGRLLT